MSAPPGADILLNGHSSVEIPPRSFVDPIVYPPCLFKQLTIISADYKSGAAFAFYHGGSAQPTVEKQEVTAKQVKACRWSSDMATARKNYKKKPKRSPRSIKSTTLSVVTVRISDEEKERIDEIMQRLDIHRYSDVMRMALQMVKHHQTAV